MPSRFTLERRIEFSDTDMAGIVHFANFFRFMESAEHAFFRSLGFQLHEQADGRVRGFARVHADCDYLRPLHYPDLVRIELAVREKTDSALAYAFAFFDGRNGEEPAARGSLKVVHVSRAMGEGRLRAAPMPKEVFERITVAESR
jgi:YbgC/YbaW family acyl-CoA thioester hydrolase